MLRLKRVGAASVQDRKLHGRMIKTLYGYRSGTVEHLGTYRTSDNRPFGKYKKRPVA